MGLERCRREIASLVTGRNCCARELDRLHHASITPSNVARSRIDDQLLAVIHTLSLRIAQRMIGAIAMLAQQSQEAIPARLFVGQMHSPANLANICGIKR